MGDSYRGSGHRCLGALSVYRNSLSMEQEPLSVDEVREIINTDTQKNEHLDKSRCSHG